MVESDAKRLANFRSTIGQYVVREIPTMEISVTDALWLHGLASRVSVGAVKGSASLIDGMSDEEFNRDRSDENPNVGKPLTSPSEKKVEAGKFKLRDRVTKTKGSSWTGRVVGFYSTDLTPVGYAVESETETGSVQIYPEAALKDHSHD